MMNIILYKDDFTDYAWYHLCRELSLIEGEYVEYGKHRAIDYIEIKGINEEHISWN